MPNMVKVRATHMGIHPTQARRVREGEEFTVPVGTKGSWFKPVEQLEAEAKAKESKKLGGNEPDLDDELDLV